MNELLKNITQQLEQRHIPYMISGSIALLTYATARMTRDIDIIVDLKLRDLEEFLPIFENGFYVHEESIREAIQQTGMFNVIDFNSGYKIDFVVKKNTEFRKNEFERRQKAFIQDIEVWIVSLEDLILSKLIWIQDFQSTRQMEDIQSLLKNDKVNIAYLKEWIDKLRLQTFGLIK